MTPETNKGCCEKCKCPDDCDQPGEHCRVIRNGKPACPCHLLTEKGLCEHGNESWDCTQCIRKALTPEKGEKCIEEVCHHCPYYNPDCKQCHALKTAVTINTDIEGFEKLEDLINDLRRDPSTDSVHIHQHVTALVEGAREEEAVRCADHERQAYERGKADGKRERDAELREKMEKVEAYGDGQIILKRQLLSLLTPNDNL